MSVLCWAVFLVPAMAGAQGTVVGVVTDAGGAPLFDAVVESPGAAGPVRTSEQGAFRVTGITSATVELRVRRLGFRPATRRVDAGTNEAPAQVAIALSPLPAHLEAVVVEVARSRASGGRLSGYHDRLQRRSSGQFITRSEIDRNDHRSLSQLIARAPGLSSHRMRGGGGVVRMRGRGCRPLVWLDGFPMSAGEVDLDAFPVSTLHGIELYLGSTTAPVTYTALRGASSCGTILLWSRGRDTDPPKFTSGRQLDLEALVFSDSVYTADEVDTPARLDRARSVEVTYPPELLATGIGGTAVAEFVVDAKGGIEPETFAVVSSPDPAFSAAVAAAIHGLRYAPAVKEGQPVRQYVQQPFGFTPANRRAAVR